MEWVGEKKSFPIFKKDNEPVRNIQNLLQISTSSGNEAWNKALVKEILESFKIGWTQTVSSLNQTINTKMSQVKYLKEKFKTVKRALERTLLNVTNNTEISIT